MTDDLTRHRSFPPRLLPTCTRELPSWIWEVRMEEGRALSFSQRFQDAHQSGGDEGSESFLMSWLDNGPGLHQRRQDSRSADA